MTISATLFIDGEAGTTGLQIRERLSSRRDLEIRSLPPEKRKDPEAKARLWEEVDLVILCLPDDAARESVALAQSLGAKAPRLLDASTAHRVAPGWVYGFPELTRHQAQAIRHAQHVANPGCYATGAIALLRPLITSHLLFKDMPLSIHAVSGYSGGGKTMIAAYEQHQAPPFEIYGLTLMHKHVPEIQAYAELSKPPLFVPSVGNFAQGMLVCIPLHRELLPSGTSAAHVEEAWRLHYAHAPDMDVIPTMGETRLTPEALNQTNKLELRVFSQDAHGHMLLVARLDNLGKGASGAAVQNLDLMLSHH